MFAHPLAEDAELRPLEPWHAEEFAAHADRSRAHRMEWRTIPANERSMAVARQAAW